MKTFVIAALVLAATGTASFANDLSEKAMKDLPGIYGGATFNPTSKPYSGALADKAAWDLIGSGQSGATANPTSKPVDGGLSDKAMRDALGRS